MRHRADLDENFRDTCLSISQRICSGLQRGNTEQNFTFIELLSFSTTLAWVRKNYTTRLQI